jgi:hypothetical protein
VFTSGLTFSPLPNVISLLYWYDRFSSLACKNYACFPFGSNTNCFNLRRAQTNENFIHEEIKSILIPWMLAITQFSILSSRLLHKNVKIKYQKLYFWIMFLTGFRIWSLTLRREHRLRVLENRVLSRICGPKREQVTAGCTLYSFMI